MKLLGLDSSGLVASVALLTDGILTAEYTVHYKKTHSQTLLPMLEEILRMCEAEPSELDAIAVAAGPGSFTGLRIGSATAKGLAQAWEKPIVPVPTTAALAANLFGAAGLICPMMDARRNQVYNGIYAFEGDKLVTLCEQRALGVEELAEELNTGAAGKWSAYVKHGVLLLGDGAEAYRSLLKERLHVSYQWAPPHLSHQRAGAVAVLGEQLFTEGVRQTAAEHAPIYLRMSQAERERIERTGT